MWCWRPFGYAGTAGKPPRRPRQFLDWCTSPEGALVRSALNRLAQLLLPLAIATAGLGLSATTAHAESDSLALELSPIPFVPQSDLGITDLSQLTIVNHGAASVTLTSVDITYNADGDAYRAGFGSCTSSIAPGASCYVSVLFRPFHYGEYLGQLDLGFDGGSATRTVFLEGVGGHLPGPVQNLTVAAGFSRNVLTWSPPAETGIPAATSYWVFRSKNGSFVNIGAAVEPTFVDGGIAPGEAATYRVATLNAAGLGASMEVTSGASPASGLVVASTGQGSVSSLYLIPDGNSSPGGDRVPLFNDTTPRYTPTVSPDGRQVVYAQESTAQQATQTDLWIMSLDGSSQPRRLTSEPYAESDPAWSPDGKSIAYTYATPSSVEVQTVSAAGGEPRRRTLNYEHASWLADNRRLVAGNAAHTGLAILDAVGKAAPIPGSQDGSEPTVSPDGMTIAYVLHGPGYDFAATLPVTGGTATELNDAADWQGLSWRPDGEAVYGERNSSRGPEGVRQIVEFDPDHGAAPIFLHVMDPAGDHNPVPVGPRVHLTSYETFSNRNVTIHFAGPDPAVDCAVDNAVPKPCTDTVALTGLTTGEHRLVVRSGAASSQPSSVLSAVWTVDTAAPALTIVAPLTSMGQTNSTAAVQYRGTDAGAGVASYDVRYRRASVNGGYTAYSSPAGFLATTSASRGVRSDPGYEYCFSVRVRDKVANLGPWTADHCADNALDDRALSASGWKRIWETGNYYNTVTRTSTAGATLSLSSVQTRRVTLFVTKCASCGRVDVYLAGQRIGSVSTYAAIAQRDVKIALPLLSSLRSGRFVLKAVTAGKNVIIDGVAFGRT